MNYEIIWTKTYYRTNKSEEIYYYCHVIYGGKLIYYRLLYITENNQDKLKITWLDKTKNNIILNTYKDFMFNELDQAKKYSEQICRKYLIITKINA